MENETVVRASWLCGGGDALWNGTSGDGGGLPDVGPCFQAAFWTVPPALAFWLLAPVSLWRTARRRRGREWRGTGSLLFWAKAAAAAALAGLAVWDLVHSFLLKEVHTVHRSPKFSNFLAKVLYCEKSLVGYTGEKRHIFDVELSQP